MYLVFTCMPDESYRRPLRSLLLYLCYTFQALTPLCVDCSNILLLQVLGITFASAVCTLLLLTRLHLRLKTHQDIALHLRLKTHQDIAHVFVVVVVIYWLIYVCGLIRIHTSFSGHVCMFLTIQVSAGASGVAEWQDWLFVFAGFGDSSGKSSEVSMVEDTVTVYHWVKQRALSSPVFLWGHSLGTGWVCLAWR